MRMVVRTMMNGRSSNDGGGEGDAARPNEWRASVLLLPARRGRPRRVPHAPRRQGAGPALLSHHAGAPRAHA
eukprot:6067268-Prymnesium_polylepis.1